MEATAVPQRTSRITPAMIGELREIVGTVKLIVDHQDAVEMNVVPSAYRLLVELYTHREDVGQVVGRNGHVIASLRALAAAWGGKNHVNVELDYITDKDNRQLRRDGRR